MKFIHVLATLVVFIGTISDAAERPNIVMLFIDDWAWNGSPIQMDEEMPNSMMPILEMPNLEKLARDGMKFRNAYASPQCSPSRVCLQTGQSSPRNGFTVYLNSLGQEYYNEKKSKGFPVISCIADETIDPEATTIPEALKPHGYVSAHIGKWHMRGDPADEGYVAHDGDTDNKPGNTLKNGLAESDPKPKRLPEDLTDPKLMFSITERAVDFMEKQAKSETPFYLQISHYAMHAGSECLPATREKYAKHPLIQAYYKKNNKQADTINIGDDPAVWLGMGEDLDSQIGVVLDKIKALGIEENTYVVLMSDNGYRHKQLHLNPAVTQPMHAHKWWAWQGGIRVPMIVRGPGIEAETTFDGNVVNYDLLPTFLDWAGGDPASLENIDGVSLANYMGGQAPEKEFLDRPLYFHYPHNRTSMPHSAIISGSRKLIHFYEKPDLTMLFDLKKDEGEVHNIAAQNPDEHTKLFDQMMGYFKEVGARMPKLNPDYDPEIYQAQKEYEARSRWGPFAGTRELDDDEKPQPEVAVNAPDENSERPPNIVFMFADDLGWGDLGCYGHPYARTPTIDQLASEGTRYTQFYVTGVTCCPSRTGFMTGLHTARFPKYPADFGFGDRVTITELLKNRGYHTGHFGKWHIGPEAASGVYGIDEYSPGENTKNSPRGRDAGLFDSAIEFIKKHADSDQPFYVNVWGHATHYPVAVHPDLEAEFKDVTVDRADFSETMQPKVDESAAIQPDLDKSMRQYLGDVWSIDQNVKRLLATLDELKLRENTVVVFSSDHGPAPVLLGGAKKQSKEFSENMLGYAGEFRGGKHEQTEGGVRAPFIIRWPEKIKAGHTDETSVISGMDWMPTLCKIAGIKNLPEQLDGEDVSDIWLGESRNRKTALFWKTSSTGKSGSMRYNHWKIHLNRRGSEEKTELYDLSSDPSESNNVAEQRTNIRARLETKLRTWMDELPESYEKFDNKKKKKKQAD